MSAWDHWDVQLSLDPVGPASLVTAWTVQPVAIGLAAVLAAAYAAGVRRIGRWPRSRTTVFALGLVLLLWTSCGPAEAYHSSLFWVWLTQTLVLWLVVPIVILFGHPLQLARAAGGPDGPVDRLLRSRPVQVVANPLIGPALVPILSFAVLFGPVPGWSITYPPVGWLLQLALLLVGAVMVLPLVGVDDDVNSLAVGLGLAIGSLELVIDALPGIVMRLHGSLVTTWFDHRQVFAWSPAPLKDQGTAGATLWVIAELIDLPFLVLVFRRWLRVDARDAANIDAVLEAERSARRAAPGPGPAPHSEAAGTRNAESGVERDAPWWLSDPAMQARLRRRE